MHQPVLTPLSTPTLVYIYIQNNSIYISTYNTHLNLRIGRRWEHGGGSRRCQPAVQREERGFVPHTAELRPSEPSDGDRRGTGGDPGCTGHRAPAPPLSVVLNGRGGGPGTAQRWCFLGPSLLKPTPVHD